jgi:cytochrome c5
MKCCTTAIFLPLSILFVFSVPAAGKQKTDDLNQGKTLYEQACAACHSKDLGGAFGFNLKDGEWIHGSEPKQIIHNVKNGFLSAGMPGFEAMYSEVEIASIVAYILSKREGFEGLAYKLYQMKSADDREVNQSKLIKSGNLAANLADFQLPEIPHYIIEFEGDFYAPKNEISRVWIEWGRNTDISFTIDGEVVERDYKFGEWVPTWPLKRGKQHLKIIYRSGHDKPHMKNVSLIVTNDDMSIKLFPASVKARTIMEGKKIELKATDKPLVQRIRTMNLPTYSITVGLPQKINFAFNTRQCSIVGLWQGEMLNVGPNVGGRGEDASLPLGDWIFHHPQAIQHTNTTQTKCHYKGYQLITNNPIFDYQIGDIEFSVSATANNTNKIDFNYSVKKSRGSKLTFTLPTATNLIWQSSQGQITDNQIIITPDAQGKFSLSAQIN